MFNSIIDSISDSLLGMFRAHSKEPEIIEPMTIEDEINFNDFDRFFQGTHNYDHRHQLFITTHIAQDDKN